MMHLQAGEWSLEFRDGDLRHIRLGEKDAMERIYFALRDEQWGTIPFTISGLKTETSAGEFKIQFDAEHKRSPVHFKWHCEIEGTNGGLLRYRFAGEALSSFKRNRLGLCLHHPMSCAGRSATITHADGSSTSAVFPALISPQQPVLNIRTMAYEVRPGRVVEVRFGGDVFEMEDQRNWSDANFKTYSTPLALPYPVEVAAGTKIEQAIELRLRYSGEKNSLPVGLILDRTSPEPRIVEKLHRLRVDHLRLEEPQRLGEVAKWNLPVELALKLGSEPEKELAALDAGDTLIQRVIVYRSDEPVASSKWLAMVRSRFPRVPVLAGSEQYFAELNRTRPSDFSQGVSFGLHPQVHASDDETIMANLASHDSLMESVRAFAKGAPVIVSPVTFGPRGIADGRLMTPFGAAWTRGAISNFNRLGAASMTVHSIGEVLGSPALESIFDGAPA